MDWVKPPKCPKCRWHLAFTEGNGHWRGHCWNPNCAIGSVSVKSERSSFIPMPHVPKMNRFGEIVHDAFGTYCYHVGSSLYRRDWRDVDVRLIMHDEDFLAEFGEQTDWRENRRLAAVNTAWSALGEQVTGLPIDFQIDQMTEANALYDGRRHALGLRR